MSMYLPMVEGGESAERMDLLLSLTRFSDTTKTALKLIYCNGWTAALAASHVGLQESNLSASVKRIIEIDKTVHALQVMT